MLEEIVLISRVLRKTKNAEYKEEEQLRPVRAVAQTVSRRMRTDYRLQNLGRAVRFKVYLPSDMFDLDNLIAFTYKGRRYTIQDVVEDVTQSSLYIEGTSDRAKGYL